jgi:hypothetical protein
MSVFLLIDFDDFVAGRGSLISFVASHPCTYGSLLSRPHYPSVSPKERRRRCIGNPNFVTTASALYLYSSLSKTPTKDRVIEKRRLFFVPLLGRGYVRLYSAFSESLGCALVASL